MLLSNRSSRRLLRRVLLLLLLALLIDTVHILHARPPTTRVTAADLRARAGPAGRNTTVFIVSVHRNTEEILRTAWNDAVVDLVRHLGAPNVYVSAVESGSQDKTKDALRDLQRRLDALGARNTVALGQTLRQQMDELNARPAPDAPRQPGWIWWAAEHRWDLRRIPYLSRVRNKAMEPLWALEKEEGIRFDKVFWVNDVAFDTDDFLTLLHTRNGDYAAACSMDFKRPPGYYDTFALRDSAGRKTASSYWPWFHAGTSLSAVAAGAPAPVRSCWNGMVVFDAAGWYGARGGDGSDDGSEAGGPPLQFRGVDDSLADLHLEASECCLVHADNALSAERGVWLNPNVRVGYSRAAWEAVRGAGFPDARAALVGAWANRWLRSRGSVQNALEGRTVQARVRQWVDEAPPAEGGRVEPGEACLINEMQIMFQNGWKHL